MPSLVGVVMGSSSDWDTMQHAVRILKEFDVAHEARVLSAHRMPDELFAYACDLDLCRSYKTSVFDFARHRRPEHYGLIVETAGPVARAAE